MKISTLELELQSFEAVSMRKWRIRRGFIGFLMVMYYVYALMFFWGLVIGTKSSEVGSQALRTAMADSIVRSDSSTAGIDTTRGTNSNEEQTGDGNPLLPRPLDVGIDQHLWITATFGFLGGVFFLTRTFIRTTKSGDLPVTWYMTRPLQGTLMAIFIYYAFRAGQLVFYNAEGSADPMAINVWTISAVAILAGIFVEEAYERLYRVAVGLFEVK